MSQEERIRAINEELNAAVDQLESLEVGTYIVAASFDEDPGNCRTRMKGTPAVLAQMAQTIASVLPPEMFQRLLTVLAMSPEFAAQRQETPMELVDPKRVN